MLLTRSILSILHTLKELIIGLAWAAINSRLGRLINSRGRVITSSLLLSARAAPLIPILRKAGHDMI